LFAVTRDMTEHHQTQNALRRERDNGMREILRDITERKHLEERAEKLRAELLHTARVNVMGAMASSLAHEINQPLAAIVMRTDTAKARLDRGKEFSRDEWSELLDFVGNEAYRAGQVIARLRRFLHKGQSERASLALGELVGEVLQLMGHDLRQAEAALNVEVAPDLPAARADRVELQQVLVNLVRNALDAMEFTPPAERAVRIVATSAEERLEIAVCDTGCGIAPEHLPRVFEPYYTTKPKGLGMGLAICRSIVEGHGGRIWAAPNADRGATFTFTLPCAPERTADAT
jgi:C4-dicarboxylate-specific signal transduction histidine kinase